MTVPEEFVVWEWLDKQGDPVYVGYGKMPIGSRKHPALKMFEMRNSEDSDLNVFLRGFKKEPKRSKKLTTSKLHRHGARAIVFQRRSELAKEGYELLSTRPWGTVTGGGKPRPVKNPRGKYFASVRAAAIHEGVNQCTITRRCNSEKSKWRYVDESS